MSIPQSAFNIFKLKRKHQDIKYLKEQTKQDQQNQDMNTETSICNYLEVQREKGYENNIDDCYNIN